MNRVSTKAFVFFYILSFLFFKPNHFIKMSNQENPEVSVEALKGGAFVFTNSDPASTFIPEEFSEEQLMIQAAVRDFGATHVFPNLKRIEKQEEGLSAELFNVAGGLGFLGANIPENYGGLGLDTNTNSVITEEVGTLPSFSVSIAAHTGIGILPIFYFGTEAQKQKYLPALASGEIQAAYCLTEPGSGSDALAARTKAILNPEGTHYSITGQKMWITNSAFASVFIVFAKIDGKAFTGFIVERDSAGLSFGAEEDKLGIKGSSTRQVFFENVQVPVTNILGEIGKGHLIAFNVLNVGRFKLGLMTLGQSKRNSKMAARYANERQQFGVSIGSFGAIKQKLADQAVQIYGLESSVYRISALIQQKVEAFSAEGQPPHLAYLNAAEEYAIECALIKVLGSEVAFNVSDHTVQVHGGNGFSEEYGAARDYRDNRINRIFEGTNEINRILMLNMLLRRVGKGELNAKEAIVKAVKGFTLFEENESVENENNPEKATLMSIKTLFLSLLNEVFEAQAKDANFVKDAQEHMMFLSDIMIDLFAMESIALRVHKLAAQGKDVTYEEKVMEVYFNDGTARIAKNATDFINSLLDEDSASDWLATIALYSQYKLVNVVGNRRYIANQQLAANA